MAANFVFLGVSEKDICLNAPKDVSFSSLLDGLKRKVSFFNKAIIIWFKTGVDDKLCYNYVGCSYFILSLHS